MLVDILRNYFPLFFILVFGLISIIVSARMILIGKNKIEHPMYDNEAKKKHAFKIGIICIIPLIIFESFFIVAAFFILFG